MIRSPCDSCSRQAPAGCRSEIELTAPQRDEPDAACGRGRASIGVTIAAAAARASLLCAGCEVLVELARPPALQLTWTDRAYLAVMTIGLFALCATTLAAAVGAPLVLLRRRLPRAWTGAWGDVAGKAVSAALIGFAAMLGVAVPLLGRRRAPFDFPAELDTALAFGLALACAVIVAASVVATALLPARVRSSRGLACFGLALVACALLMLAGVWLARLHVQVLVAPCVALGVLVAIGAGLALPVRARRSEAVVLVITALLAFAALPFSGPAQREILVARSANLLTLVRWASTPFDADGDGYWTKAIGGFDCDDTRFEVAPFTPDGGGDGFDLNCNGRDNIAPAPVLQRNASLIDRPDLVLLTVDALSARYTGPRAARGSETPQLNRWAARGSTFERAYSASTSTEFALTALLTGRVPSSSIELGHTPGHRGLALRHGLAEALSRLGYETTCVLGAEGSLPVTGCRHVRAIARGDGALEASTTSMQLALALDALGAPATSADGRREPRFVWTHLMDPHASYLARDDRARGGDAEARYRSEIRALDADLGAWLTALERQGGLARTFVVLTADHGEQLDGTGVGHGPLLRDDVLHVPMMMWGPAIPSARVRDPVSALDVFPTLLALAGGRYTPGFLHGRSLIPQLNPAGSQRPRAVFAEAFHGPRKQVAVIDGTYKLVVDLDTGARMLVDLARDPDEHHNLLESEPERAQQMLTRIRSFRSSPAGALIARPAVSDGRGP